MKIEIKYDTEVSVTKEQFKYLVQNHSESCAFRSDGSGNYWFKCWLMKDASKIVEYLNNNIKGNTVKYIY